MGLGDRDLVALMGAHSVGQAHEEFSGFPDRAWAMQHVAHVARWLQAGCARRLLYTRVLKDDPEGCA